tara:strand:+ start:902 stop:2407 length:1506 start_codon:yes stop_codon:yes gene_type:complete
MTMVSRVLGFIRDIVIAKTFGTTVAADVFFVAFKIPNLFRRLFAEGAFSQAFIPVLTESKANGDKVKVVDYIGATAGVLSLALFFVVAFGVLTAPVFIALFAPGFTQDLEKWELATLMLRITFPYLMFISITALFGSVLNTYGRFTIPALTPALLNVAMIGAALYLAPLLKQPIVALGIGVLVGGILQFIIQLIAVIRLGIFRRITFNFFHPGVRQTLRLMGPAIFGVSVAQINLMIDTLIASFLETGSISWLYYSDRLVEFPLGVFGIALATVVLPSLAQSHTQGQPQNFSATLDWALRLVLLISLPAATALAFLAEPILSALFQYGVMTERDVMMAGQSLIAYSCGLTAFIMVKILAPGFYAKQDTRTPVRIGVIAMGVNVILNLALVGLFAHAGLALATSLAAFINAGLLLKALIVNGSYRPGRGWATYILKVSIATGVMCLVLLALSETQATWTAATAFTRGMMLAKLITTGAVSYFLCAFLFGLRPRFFMQPIEKH